MAQSTSTPFTPRSTEITLIPLEIASFTAGATASESTGFTIRTLIFFEIRSSISLVCFAASSPASTTISFSPSVFAFSFAPSLNVTKNGLFKVETENPILPFPDISPDAFSVSPSIVMALHPVNPNTRTAAASILTTLFILIPHSPLLSSSVRQYRDQNYNSFYHILIIRRYSQDIQSVI